MGLTLTEGTDLSFQIPMYRTDILHQCDIAEDLAIAFNYNNIEDVLPPVNTAGKQNVLNKISDICRGEIAACGYNECLNTVLCSFEDEKKFFRVEELKNAVVIANPKTRDFQISRTTLIPGMLKTLYSNKKNKLPLQLFECSDICLLDDTTDTGARNERRLAVLYTHTQTSCLDVIFFYKKNSWCMEPLISLWEN